VASSSASTKSWMVNANMNCSRVNISNQQMLETPPRINNHDVLSISVVMVDVINSVRSPLNGKGGTQWNHWEWELENLNNSAYEATKELAIEPFWRTSLCDEGHEFGARLWQLEEDTDFFRTNIYSGARDNDVK